MSKKIVFTLLILSVLFLNGFAIAGLFDYTPISYCHPYSLSGKYTVFSDITNEIADQRCAAAGYNASGTAVRFRIYNLNGVLTMTWEYGGRFGNWTAWDEQNTWRMAIRDIRCSDVTTHYIDQSYQYRLNYYNGSMCPTTPRTYFNGTPLSGPAPLTVKFIENSTGWPMTWAWDFGDGNTSSLKNPQHTYASAGDYTVNLTTMNAWGSNTSLKLNYINVTYPVPVADFSGTPTSGNSPLDVQFTDASTGIPTSWSWDFGDGSFSTTQNPVHRYTAVGTYNVSLAVENIGGNDTKEKAGYVTVAGQKTYYKYGEIGESGAAAGMAEGFWNTIHSNGNIEWYPWEDAQGQPRNIIYPTEARQSHWTTDTANWVERSDFAYFSGHGNSNLIAFSYWNESADSSQIRLGSSRTKWAVLDSCYSLDEQHWTSWQQSFTGLRMLLGWHSNTTPTSTPISRGEMFAKFMMGEYPATNSPRYSILDAWALAAKYTWENYEAGEDIYTATIYDINCKDDYLPGWGGFSTIPSNNHLFNKTLVASKNVVSGTNPVNTRLVELTSGRKTINESVPDASEKIMIYRSVKPGYTREWVRTLAKKLGMSGEIVETPEAYFASEQDQKDNIFIVHKDKKVIVFSKRNSASSGDMTDDNAISVVKQFLNDADLMPPDALEPSVAYNTGEGLSSSGEITKGWKQIVVSFPREINGMMVWNSQLMVTVDAEGNIVDLFLNWRDYEPYKELSLKTPEQVFEEFQSQPPGISETSLEKINVNDVALVYAGPSAASIDEELKPIYVFEGTIQREGNNESFESAVISASQELLEYEEATT